jgi:hypothetical protein
MCCPLSFAARSPIPSIGIGISPAQRDGKRKTVISAGRPPRPPFPSRIGRAFRHIEWVAPTFFFVEKGSFFLKLSNESCISTKFALKKITICKFIIYNRSWYATFRIRSVEFLKGLHVCFGYRGGLGCNCLPDF